MKHIKGMMLLLPALMLAAVLSSCGAVDDAASPDNGADITEASGQPEAPPELKLYVNEEEAVVYLAPRTYEWHIDNGDGTMTGINADAPHPLAFPEQLAAVDAAKAGGAVEIILEEGMGVTAVSWWDEAESDYANSHTVEGEVAVANKTVYRLEIEAGRVYDIHVDFGEAGDSFYAFAAK